MRHLILFCFFALLCFNVAEAQTYAGIPDASTVLVVYNANSDTSEMVMEYYTSARGIPNPLNVVALNLPDTTITIDDVTHSVIVAENGDYIRDSVNHVLGTWYATEHAWKYFLNNIV